MTLKIGLLGKKLGMTHVFAEDEWRTVETLLAESEQLHVFPAPEQRRVGVGVDVGHAQQGQTQGHARSRTPGTERGVTASPLSSDACTASPSATAAIASSGVTRNGRPYFRAW